MYNFEYLLKKSSKDVSRSLNYSETDAQSLYKMIKKYYSLNPDASDQEVYKYFSDLFAEINVEIVNLPIIKNAAFEYNICKYLNKNQKDRKEAYDKVIEEEKNGKEKISSGIKRVYTCNKKSSARVLIKQALKELREQQDEYSEEDKETFRKIFNMSKKMQSEYKKRLSPEGRRSVEILRDLFDGDEFAQVSNFLKNCEPTLGNHLKKNYIKSIMVIGNRLKEFGLLEIYCKNQKKLFHRLGMSELVYHLNEEEKKNEIKNELEKPKDDERKVKYRDNSVIIERMQKKEDAITVEDLFKEENLQKMTLNQLAILNTFWLNRFTKELLSLNKSFFIVKNLNLLDEIKKAVPFGKSGFIRVPIDENLLKNLYDKMNFLRQITDNLFKNFQKEKGDHVTEEISEGSENLIRRVNVEPALRKLEKDLSEDYRNYFSDKHPGSNNDFIEDIEDYRILENAIHNTYIAKDKNIVVILANLYEEGFSKNWGLILNDQLPNSKMVLLSIDLEGLNMPIRIHLEKTMLEDFLRTKQDDGKMLFPIYDGEKDFDYEGIHISTPILMPTCNKQKIALKSLVETGNHHYQNLLEHLYFLSDGKYPDHLKIEKLVKKKNGRKIVKDIPPKRYIDLSTNEIFEEKRKGEFTLVSDTKSGNEGR